VTSADDLTTDYLVRRLEDRQIDFFRFNTEKLLVNYDISITLTRAMRNFSISDKVRAVTLRSEAITGVYFRRPEPPLLPDSIDDPDQKTFTSTELRETLRSLWRMIPRHKWLNSLDGLWLASNKIRQLMLATDIGFMVPPTLISSRSSDILRFAEAHGGAVIAKAIKNGFVYSGSTLSVMFTSLLTDDDRGALAHNDCVIPSIVQPKIDKACDVRITIVGDSLFATSIHSQEHAATSIDWRRWEMTAGLHLTHNRFSLPSDTADMCLELNRRLDLRFSCIDMVLSKSGDLYFLESNPNGQWAWIEDMVKYPIRDSLIDQLLGHQC
jgi:glutathione synthase/RimK-type ligase-like ATP-grasp enzyme